MELALQTLEKVKSGALLNADDLQASDASKILATVCCFCLSDDDCESLTQKLHKPGLPWADIVAQVLQIYSWTIEDAQICDSCSSTLKLFHKFRQKARKNFTALEQLSGMQAEQEQPTREFIDWTHTDIMAEDLIEEELEEMFESRPDDETVCEVEFLDEESLLEEQPAVPVSEPENIVDLETGKNDTQTEVKRPKRHVCPMCGHKVESPSKLKLHILARHRYSTIDVWSTHPTADENSEMTEIMQRKMCEICGKSFPKNYSLIIHMRRHIGDRKFECDECDMKFVAGYALRRHKMTHSGEKPLACRHGCSEMFRNHSSRIRHEQTLHSEVRPYSCEICGKAFKRLQNLVTHRQIHGGAKPYSCEKCGVNFRHSHHLKAHQKIHERGART